jgi:hypothetical protein
MGLDADASLAEEFNRRAGELPAVARVGDAAGFSLEREFGLALAPMQLVQLLADAEERVACLRCTAAHLRPGGLLAAAIVDDIPSAGATARECAPPLPDARELDGWVYSSLPLETVVDGETIVVRRLRQVVSPGGGLSEELSEVDLRMLTAAQLESEAAAAGLRPGGRLEIPATDAHVGSNVVLLEKES